MRRLEEKGEASAGAGRGAQEDGGMSRGSNQRENMKGRLGLLRLAPHLARAGTAAVAGRPRRGPNAFFFFFLIFYFVFFFF